MPDSTILFLYVLLINSNGELSSDAQNGICKASLPEEIIPITCVFYFTAILTHVDNVLVSCHSRVFHCCDIKPQTKNIPKTIEKNMKLCAKIIPLLRNLLRKLIHKNTANDCVSDIHFYGIYFVVILSIKILLYYLFYNSGTKSCNS